MFVLTDPRTPCQTVGLQCAVQPSPKPWLFIKNKKDYRGCKETLLGSTISHEQRYKPALL